MVGARRAGRKPWRRNAGHEYLGGIGHQQHHVRWPAFSVVGRLLVDLRTDADSEPDARLDVHAGRLCRLQHGLDLPSAVLARRADRGAGDGRLRRLDGAVPASPPRRLDPRPGAGHARIRLHHCRFLPDGVERRSDLGEHALGARRRDPRLRPVLSHLSDRDHPHRRHHRSDSLGPARPHPARRDDPRRRRRSADGARRRHSCLAAVHHRLLSGRRARRLRRPHGRAHPVGLSRSRLRHAAARAGGCDSRRRRQPAGLADRQHRHRLPLQLRPGDGARARLLRAVPADGGGAGTAAARAVRQAGAMTPSRIALVVALLVVVTVPLWVPGDYYVSVCSQILIYAIFALSVDVLLGYGGLVSLGHAGLFGLASYTVAVCLGAGFGHVAAIAVALVVTLAGTAVFAALSLRTTGIGFIMITLALGQIMWGLAYRWVSLTNGDNGLSVAHRPMPFGIELDTPSHFYYATVVIFLLMVIATWIFVYSPFGASLKGTRDQPRRMTALGYHVWLIRFYACLFSGLLAAVAGILFVYYTEFISPPTVSLTSSAEPVLMVISGGSGTLLGPIVGAALIEIVKNVASAYITRWNMMLGAIFVAIVIFMPEGLVPGTIQLLRRIVRARGREPAPAAAGQPTAEKPSP